MLMQNIYVYDPYGKVGKLIWYRSGTPYPYIIAYSHPSMSLYSGIVDGRIVTNCAIYKKNEIKLLHKKPLRHFIEKRQGK